MFRFLERHKRIFFLSGTGICVLIIIFSISPLSGPGFVSDGFARAMSPFQRGAASVADWFSAAFNSGEFAALNRELMLEIEKLRLENSRLMLLTEEVEELYALLNMQSQYMGLESVGVRIIGRSPNLTDSSFHIDKGNEAGITENMAVFAGGGLFGAVRQVNHRHSVVVSIFDSRFAAAGMCARTGGFGVVRGGARVAQYNLLRMDHIGLASEISPGDEIVTSHYSAIFPQGILIGTVESVSTNSDGLSKYAHIRPAADVYSIQMALVITQSIFNE